MIYYTQRLSPKYRKMSLEELWSDEEFKPALITNNSSNTITHVMLRPSAEMRNKFCYEDLYEILHKFTTKWDYLYKTPREEMYETFHIPKKSGGLRRIDAPKEDLMIALRELKRIFENDFEALYHTSAFAYIKNRSTIDAVKRHQKNQSKWFGKYDLSNFFGSTTLDYTMKIISQIYPFSVLASTVSGHALLEKTLELGFLNGGLPQGTPLSPLLTNIIMIPFDYTLTKKLGEFGEQSFVYTRYADDFIISSRYSFDPKEIENLINDTLAKFSAPFSLNSSKTRYGSSAGRNWNLGVMLGSSGEITVGHKKKRQFKAMLTSYIMDKKNNKEWELHDIQILEGYRNYYRMIEGETIDKIVEHLANKFEVETIKRGNGTNIKMIYEDLKK